MLWRINFIWARTFQNFRIFAGTIQNIFCFLRETFRSGEGGNIDWLMTTVDCVINFDLVNPFFFMNRIQRELAEISLDPPPNCRLDILKFPTIWFSFMWVVCHDQCLRRITEIIGYRGVISPVSKWLCLKTTSN